MSLNVQTKSTNLSQEVSIYEKEKPMNDKELAIVAAQIGEIYKLPNEKVKLMAEIMKDEQWCLSKAKDALKYVTKHNIYPNVEPAAFLSYDNTIKLYTLDECIDTHGKGTAGYIPYHIPDRERPLGNGIKTDIWFIKAEDKNKVPKNWKEIK